ERQTERAVRTHDREARNSVQFPLERNGHLLFHLLRRMTGELRDHLRRYIGNVRIGLNLQSLPRHIPKRGHQDRDQPDQFPPPQAERYEPFDHCSRAPSRISTLSPTLTPLLMIVRPPCCSPVVTVRCSKVFAATSTKTV